MKQMQAGGKIQEKQQQQDGEQSESWHMED